MLKLTGFLLLITALTSCTTNEPIDYFNQAILNTNMLVGIGNQGMERELASPSIRLNKDGSTSPMLQHEILEQKTTFISDALKKVKALKVTEETKAMIDTSIALHSLALEACNNEYKVLANLYETKASDDKIAAQALLIQHKYSERLNALHTSLTKIGKVYAAKHNIPVQWDIRTSPGNH